MNIFIILPTQLFEYNNFLKKMDKIFIIEDPFYFTSKKFHKQKLILHRSSMKLYFDKLKLHYDNVYYMEFNNIDYNYLLSNNIHIFDPIDKPILNKFKNANKLTIYDSPAFLENISQLTEYRNKFTNKKNYYHDNFYKWQRKRLNILIDENNKPIGGKWSFDKLNRNKYDKKYIEPKIKTYSNKYIDEATIYINTHFNDNFGLVEDFYYPINHEDAKLHLQYFIKFKLTDFGKFQDGISKTVIYGSHSILSPLLNIGLITPEFVLNEIMKNYNENNIIAIEAFIRQLIGWRSYVRFIYYFHGDDMMKMNKLNHKNKLPLSWYSGNTNISIINDMIFKVKKYAYLHHIERLMIMGNIGILFQINPNDLYNWFMICFIDSYEWVMIPNIYGMSQYSLTDISMMSRPYISSSNYIKKMSDYKYEKWFDLWDALYWFFIYTHKELLSKIYSTAIQVKLLNKMSNDKLNKYIEIANKLI